MCLKFSRAALIVSVLIEFFINMVTVLCVMISLNGINHLFSLLPPRSFLELFIFELAASDFINIVRVFDGFLLFHGRLNIDIRGVVTVIFPPLLTFIRRTSERVTEIVIGIRTLALILSNFTDSFLSNNTSLAHLDNLRLLSRLVIVTELGPRGAFVLLRRSTLIIHLVFDFIKVNSVTNMATAIDLLGV